jgi:hypothetical protein
MADRPSLFADERRKFVDQPREEALKLAQAPPAARKVAWSKYFPFPAGSDLAIEGRALLIYPFSGTVRVDERTENKLALSFAVKPLGSDTIKGNITINYKEDGGGNTTDFFVRLTNQKKDNVAVNILSNDDERVMTPIPALDLVTNFPGIDPVTLKVVHFRPKEKGVELEAEFVGGNAVAQMTKKPPEAPAKK